MVIRHVRSVAAALVVALAAVAVVAADEFDNDGGSQKKAPAKKVARDPAAPLTIESLGTLLENMGLEATPEKGNDGKVVGYGVRRSFAGEYNGTLYYKVSPDRAWVHLYVRLFPLPDPKVPADKLLALLEASDSPCSFTYLRKPNLFVLEASVPNRGVNAKLLNHLAGKMSKTLAQTSAHWDPSKWEKPRTRAARAKAKSARTGK